MYIHLYIKGSLIVIHECSRTAIQDTLKPWCRGSYADLAYSSYSDAASLKLFNWLGFRSGKASASCAKVRS